MTCDDGHMRFDNPLLSIAIGAFVAIRALTLGEWLLAIAGAILLVVALVPVFRRHA